MIDKDYLSLLERRLIDGESSQAFKIFMFSNYVKWKDINLEELRSLLELIKLKELSLYAFIPFWYRFMGVDTYKLYEKMNEFEWIDDECFKIIKSFDTFPKDLSLSDMLLLDRHNLSLASFIEIRLRLLTQGIERVNKVEFYW